MASSTERNQSNEGEVPWRGAESHHDKKAVAEDGIEGTKDREHRSRPVVAMHTPWDVILRHSAQGVTCGGELCRMIQDNYVGFDLVLPRCAACPWLAFAKMHTVTKPFVIRPRDSPGYFPKSFCASHMCICRGRLGYKAQSAKLPVRFPPLAGPPAPHVPVCLLGSPLRSTR